MANYCRNPGNYSAAEHVVDDADSDEDLRFLLAPGLSLGGVRSKAPAYDLNPVHIDIKPRVLATTIDLDDGAASLDLAMSVAGYFELSEAQARGIAAQVGRAVQRWCKEAVRLGLAPAEIGRMASAFEHEDLDAALSIS